MDELIPDNQLVPLTVGFVVGATAIVAPGVAAAGKEVWLSHILAFALGLVITLVYAKLWSQMEGESLVQYLARRLGMAGWVVGLVYVWFGLHLSALILVDIGDFMTTAFLPDTPFLVIVTTFVVVAWHAVRGGLEVLGRLAIILVGMALVNLTTTTLLLTPQMDFNAFLPVVERGWMPIMVSTFQLFSFPFGEVVLLLMLLPSSDNGKRAGRTLVRGVVMGGLVILVVHIRDIAVLPESVLMNAIFPRLYAVRLISIAQFLERLEPLVVLTFMASALIKLCVSWYAAVAGLAHLLHLKDFRGLTLPTGIFLIILSEVLFDSTQELIAFSAFTWPFYAFPLEVLVPVLLLILGPTKAKSQDNVPAHKKG